MIIHIVIFELYKNDIKSIENIKNELLRLKSLPFARELDVVEKGNILKTHLHGDLILFSKFNSIEELHAYMEDQKHLEIIKATSSNIKEKYVLDFTITDV